MSRGIRAVCERFFSFIWGLVEFFVPLSPAGIIIDDLLILFQVLVSSPGCVCTSLVLNSLMAYLWFDWLNLGVTSGTGIIHKMSPLRLWRCFPAVLALAVFISVSFLHNYSESGAAGFLHSWISFAFYVFHFHETYDLVDRICQEG